MSDYRRNVRRCPACQISMREHLTDSVRIDRCDGCLAAPKSPPRSQLATCAEYDGARAAERRLAQGETWWLLHGHGSLHVFWYPVGYVSRVGAEATECPGFDRNITKSRAC